jgi:hypothetical protein
VQTPIVVTDADVMGLELQPETGGAVSGKFRVEGGERVEWTLMNVKLLPLAAASEQASDAEVIDIVRPREPTSVNEDGTFEFQDVTGGEYQLVVGTNSDYLRDFYTKSVRLDGHEVADSGFAVNGGAALEVLLSGKGATIEGRVLNTKGFVAADVVVVSVPVSEKRMRPDAYQRAQTNAYGRFELHGLIPGEFVVVALEKDPGDVGKAEFLKKYEEKGVRVSLA